MNMINEVLRKTENASCENIRVNYDVDYKNEEGLWMCGKCHTPKQIRQVQFGNVFEPMVSCKCEGEKRDAENNTIERKEREKLITENTEKCFPHMSMAKWTFENDDKKNARVSEITKRYAECFEEHKADGMGLLLYGSVGTGKTYNAACIANELLRKGYTVLMTSFTRIANKLPAFGEDKQAYYDELNSYDLLIIDDLSAERKTEFMQEIITFVIDNRCLSGKPMIVTTNMSKEEIFSPADISNQRICDRLIELCVPVEVSVDGGSRRRDMCKIKQAKLKKMLGIS